MPYTRAPNELGLLRRSRRWISVIRRSSLSTFHWAIARAQRLYFTHTMCMQCVGVVRCAERGASLDSAFHCACQLIARVLGIKYVICPRGAAILFVSFACIILPWAVGFLPFFSYGIAWAEVFGMGVLRMFILGEVSINTFVLMWVEYQRPMSVLFSWLFSRQERAQEKFVYIRKNLSCLQTFVNFEVYLSYFSMCPVILVLNVLDL